MRWWVWSLILINLGLFAYFSLNKEVTIYPAKSTSIDAAKLKILTQKELESMPKKEAQKPTPLSAEESSAAVPVEATSCYKWGNFTTNNLPSAQVVLVRLGLQAEAKQESIPQQEKRYWVYYPPLKTPALAQQKANEIKLLGVGDLFIVQDSQWRNAISFGLFNDEQLASNLLTSLQQKGVKGATKALRNQGNALSSLLIKGVKSDAALELHKVKNEFLGTELSPTSCN